MGDRTGRDRCPYPAGLAGYVGVIAAIALILKSVLPWSPWYVLGGSALGTAVLALVLEFWRGRPNACPWLDYGAVQRVFMYLALFVVGLAVVFPGVWPDRSLEWYARIPFVLFVVSAAALLRVHKTVDHGELEEAGIGRGTVLLSRSPLYLLVAFVALPVILAIVSLIRGSR